MTRSTNMEHVEVLRDIRNWMASVYWDSRVDALDAAIAALSAPKSGDWVLVPREPTEAMLDAGDRGWGDPDESSYGTYAAMLAAAPQPPAEAHEDEVVCLECGQPTMHMGQVCYACLHPADDPAEAQAQGGGEAELRRMVARLAAHVRPTCGELWAEAERLLNRTAPPSAPVGVEAIVEAIISDPANATDTDTLRRCVASALAQQPSVAPAKVEAVADVLHKLRRLALVIREHGTCAPLALDHIGDDLERALSQQPAAVDDTRRLEYLIDNELLVHRLSDTGLWMVTTGDLTPAIDGSEYDTWREAIDDALAAQQGGES